MSEDDVRRAMLDPLSTNVIRHTSLAIESPSGVPASAANQSSTGMVRMIVISSVGRSQSNILTKFSRKGE